MWNADAMFWELRALRTSRLAVGHRAVKATPDCRGRRKRLAAWDSVRMAAAEHNERRIQKIGLTTCECCTATSISSTSERTRRRVAARPLSRRSC